MSTFGNFTVTRASTKNVLGSNGLLQSVANNVPAFEFNANGSYKGLLVEPGATNLLTYSQAFDDASWSKTDITINANTVVAPDGTTTADDAVTAGGLLGRLQRNIAVANDSATHTKSVFIKKTSGFGLLIISYSGGTDKQGGIQFNKSTGQIENLPNGFGAGFAAPVASSVVDYGDYYRFSVSVANNSLGNTTLTVTFNPNRGTSFGNYDAVNATTAIWQAQLETGAVATSPIVTTGSTASRVADVVSLTGASSLIGQTEGTLYAEVALRTFAEAGSPVVSAISINVGADNLENCIVLGVERQSGGINRIYALVQSSNATQAGLFGSTISAGTYKIALAYKQDDFALYANGVQLATDTSGLLPVGTLSEVFIGSRRQTDTVFLNDHVRSVALFPTRLSNAQLASLTTL
jgi:hypothetical protein